MTAPLHALVQGPDAASIGYFRVPDTDVSEATDALIGDEEELLDPFEKEHDADETANENRGAFTLSEFLQRRNGHGAGTPPPPRGDGL